MAEKTDWYAIAHVDGAVAASLSHADGEPFWRQCYITLIHSIKQAGETAGHHDPDMATIVGLIEDDDRLGEFIDEAAKAAARDGRPRADALRRWYAEEWMGLDVGLRRNVVAGLRKAAESGITVTRRRGAQRAEPVAIGNRRGPWHSWDTSTLPARTREAAETAMAELYGQQGASRTTPRASGEQRPGEAGLRLLAAGMRHAVQAAEHIRQAGVQLGRAAAAGPGAGHDGRHARRLFRTARENVVSLIETLMVCNVEYVEAEEKALAGAAARARAGPRPARSTGGAATERGPKAAAALADGKRPLAGRRVSFVGKMSVPQTTLIGKAIEAGAKVNSAPSGRTTFVVLGEVRNPNNFSLKDAKRLGIEMISETEFNARLEAAPPEAAAKGPAEAQRPAPE